MIMKKLLSLTAIFAMAMVVLTGCDKDKPDTVEPGKTGLTLSIPTPAFKFDATTAFTVTASAKVEADLTVTLTSSNPAAATVPATVVIKAGTDQIAGVVTGVAEGKSTITIAASDVELTVASVEVTVTKEVPPVPEKVNVSIATTFAEVAPGAKIPFTVTAEKAITEEALVITLTSSNPAAATVPATVTIPVGETKIAGEITGVAAGEATITISSDKINATVASIPVTVKEGAATAVALSIATASADVEVGMNVKFTITTPVAPTADLTINLASSTVNATVPATIVLPAGKMSVQGDIAGALIGTAVVTISAAETTITKATVDVNVIERQNINYCELNYEIGSGSYNMLDYFKLGEVKVAGANRATTTGSGPLATTFSFAYDYDKADYNTGGIGTDQYTFKIFADWNRSGKFVEIYKKDFKPASKAGEFTGEITIPENIASSSVLRAVLAFTDDPNKTTLNSEGCGNIESGSAIDFTYTKQ